MIVLSAVRIYFDENVFCTFCGKRHPDCYELIYKMNINPYEYSIVEGFITDDDIFLNRHDAKNYAISHNQLKSDSQYLELYSEDIW